MSGLHDVELQPLVQARAGDIPEKKAFRERREFETVLRRNPFTRDVQEWDSNLQQRTFAEGRVRNGSSEAPPLRQSRSGHTHTETQISQAPALGFRNYCRAPSPDSVVPDSLP